jgi:hypothetical protein
MLILGRLKIMHQRLIKIIKYIISNFINRLLEEIYLRRGKANSARGKSQKNKSGCVITQLWKTWFMLAKKNGHYYFISINFSKKIIIRTFKIYSWTNRAWWKILLMVDICQELQLYFRMRVVHLRKGQKLLNSFLWRDLLLLMLLLIRGKRVLEI